MERIETEAGPALFWPAEKPQGAVLFAAGRGGDPARHATLLAHLASAGCSVVAPVFELLPSPMADAATLGARLKGLQAAAGLLPDLPLYGVGHSIGGVCLLALAGATPWTLAREQVVASAHLPFRHLILMAPPTGYFRAPKALDGMSTPLTLHYGQADTVTPPAQGQALADAVHGPAKLIIDEGAGHFTYMDTPPPNAAEPHPDAAALRARIAAEIVEITRS